MQSVTRIFCALAIAMLVMAAHAVDAYAGAPQGKFAEVNGVRLHYLIAGKGNPVLLLHATPKPAICGCR